MPRIVKAHEQADDEDQALYAAASEADRIIQKYKAKVHSPVSGIRAFCVECMGGQVREIPNCTSHQCSLYPFRMGKNTLDKRARVKEEDDDA